VQGGVAAFTSLANQSAGSFPISFQGGGLTSLPSNPVSVNPGVADHFIVTAGFTNPDVAGTVGSVTVQAVDHYGNIAESGPDQYEGTVNLTSTDEQASGLTTFSFDAAVHGSYTLDGVILKTAGYQTITATDSLLSTMIGSTVVDVTAAAADQLVFTTMPHDPVTAGQGFNLVVSAEDPFHNVDPAYHGMVTLSLSNEPSFTAAVQARNGVAGFAGLTLDAGAQGGSIQATTAGLTSATSNPINVEPPPSSPPTVLSERVVSIQNTNNQGKKVGKPVPGFRLVYSTVMGASAAVPGDYHVFSKVTKHVKKQNIPTYKQVKSKTTYNQATNTVTLTVKSKQPFAMGGRITITGVTDQAGVALDPRFALFTINPKANEITRGSE
jgi:hypothetical protein